MKVIKAVGVGGPEVLTMLEVEVPVPGPGQVLVKGDLAAVNFADINARRGTYRADKTGLFHVDLGLEIYGHVAALGEGVTRFEPGQRVAGFSLSGAYAEYVLADQGLIWLVPDGVSDEQAAAFPTVGQTAFHLLTSAARLLIGESVMITAAGGGVGSTAIQVARLLGAGPVLAVAGSSQGAFLAHRLGADFTLDTSDQGLEDAMAALEGISKVDIVLDGVGGELRQQALRCLSPFGRMVQFGNSSGVIEELPPLREMREHCIGVFGFHLGLMRSERKEALMRSATQLLEWLSMGRLNIAIDGILPLSRVAEAHTRLENRQVRGKLLLSVSGVS
jgi:NADPH2:quinone reductase